MTERERLILTGAKFAPQTADESAIKTAIDNAGQGGGGSDLPTPGTAGNVLTDNGTKWVSATPTVITLTGTVDVDTFEITLPSGAFTDVSAAVSSHKTVKISASDTNGILTVDLYLTLYYGGDFCVFSGRIFNGDTELVTDVTYTLDDSDVMTLTAISDQLPPVSENGKILGTVEGKYALVSPAAINNYVVHFTLTVDPDTQEATISTDNKSVAEIYAAIDAGKNVYAELDVTINGVDVTQRFYPTMYASTLVCFGANLVDTSGTPAVDPYVIMGVHSGNMDTWSPVTT